MSVIEIKELTRNFDEIVAVNHLQLSIDEGEMFGIVGPDGAGKTTTFRMLCGVLTPTSGSANILGYDLLKDSRKINRKIGYLPQRFSLYGDLSIDENIEFFAEINEVYDFKSRREELLEFTRLTSFRNRLADQLSGGMKQKLALACTLIHHPKIIFLDEPTTGVDPVSRRDFWKILSTLLESKITIVMSTPYLDEAERCSRIALMNEGRCMALDSPGRIKEKMEGEVLEIVCGNIREAVKILKCTAFIREVQAFGDRLNVIVENRDRDFPLIKEFLKQSGNEITDWRVVAPSLENVFISLMSDSSSSYSAKSGS
jgi:ABC-2 type transport system ATP-binding protein